MTLEIFLVRAAAFDRPARDRALVRSIVAADGRGADLPFGDGSALTGLRRIVLG